MTGVGLHFQAKRTTGPVLLTSLAAFLFAAVYWECAAAKSLAAGPDSSIWVPAMKKLHGSFEGERGTRALFGDSITVSKAFWCGLQYTRKGADAETVKAFERVKSRLHTLDLQTPQDLRELFRYAGESVPLVSAHRGGAQPGFPENCVATFEKTLRHTFAAMEIDPRYAKDGEIVVHHDPSLERTTTGKGRVAEWTLQELKELRLKDSEGAVTDFQIPTLDEVLQWARGKTVLVLDQKDVSVEARVRKIEDHRAEAYAMLIVYSYRDARKCYELNKNIMMEVMIPNRREFEEFDKAGVPWENIIAFIGHTPPKDVELMQMVHAKGTCCIVGTSRNLDRQLAINHAGDTAAIEQGYRTLLTNGSDLIETDLPGEVAKLLYGKSAIPASKSRFFRSPPVAQ